MLFIIIPSAQCVLKTHGGVYRQVDVYHRGRHLFARYIGGFIALRRDNMTSHPRVRWEYIDGVEWRHGDGEEWGALVLPGAASMQMTISVSQSYPDGLPQ
jgi:hypothetical protein